MNKMVQIGLALLLSFSLSFFVPEIASANTGGYDISKVKETSENVDLDSLGALAKEYSVPIVIILVVLSGFSALLGLVFKPLKVVSGSLLGIGILFYVLVNFAPQIVGILLAVIESVMSRVTGE